MSKHKTRTTWFWATVWMAGALVIFVMMSGVSHSAYRSQQEESNPTGGDPSSEEEVTIVFDGGVRQVVKLAFPTPLEATMVSGEAAEAARTVEETLRADLQASRIFDIQGPRELSVLSLSGDSSRDFELYRSLGSEVLLQLSIRFERKKVVLEGTVTHLQSGEVIVAKRYRGDYDVARRVAHTFADEVVLYFSGRRGIALSSIAFYSDRSGNKELYLMDYDGHNQRPITAHRSTSMSPTWSPDVAGLAYVSFFRGPPGIFWVDLKTGRKRDLLVDGSHNFTPSFSPDGARIAFARSLSGNTEIFSVRRDGTGLTRLTHSSGIDTNPAWSRSGREIAFTSSRSGAPQIYVMDSDGANLRRISYEGQYNDGADWSPDGTQIGYSSRRGHIFQISVTELVSLNTRTITAGTASNESPSFAPNGRSLAFTSTRRSRGVKNTQIYVVGVNGGNAQRLTDQGNNLSPAWSGYFR